MAKFLIIDDSRTVRLATKMMLEKMGHVALEAGSGKLGYELYQANPDTDFLMLDFNMPGWNGIETCKKIKELPGSEALRVFMVTTETELDLKKLAKEVGVSAWLVKGQFDAKALGELISKFEHSLSSHK